MELGLAIEGRLSEHLAAEADSIAATLRRAAQEGADVVKRDWRRAVRAAGLGEKVANTIRGEVYPKRGSAGFRAAAFVFSRAPHILQGHAGGTATPQGQYLAVPTEFTPLSRRAGRGARGSMKLPEFLETFGQNSLARVPLANGNIALVARAGFAVSRSKTRTRGLGRSLTSSRRGERELIMYVLTRSVNLPRRLDLEAMYARAERHWPRIVRAALARALGTDAPAATGGGAFAQAAGAGTFAGAGGPAGFGLAA